MHRHIVRPCGRSDHRKRDIDHGRAGQPAARSGDRAMRAQDARGARFEGCDAPMGIPEPQRPIFSERLQVQTPATVARSGDGPGLSIVSRILNPYPLKLEVESTPGNNLVMKVIIIISSQPPLSSHPLTLVVSQMDARGLCYSNRKLGVHLKFQYCKKI